MTVLLARSGTGLSTGLAIAADAGRGLSCEHLIVFGEAEHHLPGQVIVHLFGQDTRLFGSVAPVLRIVEVRSVGHDALLP